jgi:CDP-diglyceride synthetase
MMLPSWLKALVLLTAVHAAPWAAGRLLGARFSTPMDAGLTWFDGRRLLGENKTWRGLLAGTTISALAAPLLGYPARLGLTFAALALSGDAASSFIKRRCSLPPGTDVPALDQLPEALLPLLCLSGPLGIGVTSACLVAGVFLLLDLALMPLRHPASSAHASHRR